MEKEFVPQEQSLELKELGFDEECFSYVKHLGYDKNKDKVQILSRVSRSQIEDSGLLLLKIPTFSQAFRWFREKYDLTWEHQFDDSNISLYVGEIAYPDNNLDFFKIIEVEYGAYNKAYEEAELECLKKLIEIVKKK